MKKLFAILAILAIPSILFATPIQQTVPDTANYRATLKMNGDFVTYESTRTAASNFELNHGSITKCSSIAVTNGITAATGGFTTLTATNATMTGVAITTMTVSSATATNLTVTGNVVLSSYTKVQAYMNSANQSIGATAYTKLLLDGESIDTLNEFDTATSSFTAKYAGYYLVTVKAALVTAGAFTGRSAIMVNGGFASEVYQAVPSGALFQTALISLSAGDIVRVDLYNNDSGAHTVTGGARYTTLTIIRIP